MSSKDEIRLQLYIRDGRECHYCHIKEEDFVPIWGLFYPKKRKDGKLTGRGKILEIDRKYNTKGYNPGDLDKYVLSCPLCNCAKSNILEYEEVIEIGKLIEKFWRKRQKTEK